MTIPWIVGAMLPEGTIRTPDSAIALQIFPVLDAGIRPAIIKALEEKLHNPRSSTAWYTPFFFKSKSDAGDPLLDHDGFALDMFWAADACAIPPGCGASFGFRVQASYKVDTDNGFLRVRSVGVHVRERDPDVLPFPAEGLLQIDKQFRITLPPTLQSQLQHKLSVGINELPCVPSDADLGATLCRSPRGIPRKLVAALAFKLWSDAGGPASGKLVSAFEPIAVSVVAGIEPDSYYCGPKDLEFQGENPSNVCRYRPKVARVNVLPSGIEAVWSESGRPLSPHFQIAQALAPDIAGTCPTIYNNKNVSLIPTYQIGDIHEQPNVP